MIGEVLIVKKRGGGERSIAAHKWSLDRHTPVGEPADYYELMPHGGRRWIDPKTIIRREKAPAL